MGENPLHRLMNPASIATVGAGNNFMKMGTMHALSLVHDGYAGKLYPLHPREKTVLGVRAYESVRDLPEAPDLALLVVPSTQVLSLIEEFGEKGTKSAIIVTAGFGELGEEGLIMQDRLNELAGKYGIRFLGPNCMGIINADISLNTTVMPYTAGPGSLGFASQSGTYVTQTIPYLAKRGIRFSKAISVGNCANIDITCALEYLGEDTSTRAISLYIEGIRDIPRFIQTARRVTSKKPVLAQYVGGSDAGARSSLGHTGSMAAPDHLYDGLFRQAGIIRVQTVEELYAIGAMMANQPALKGNRIGVLTNSGGPGSAMANALEKGGLRVPEFSEGLREKLRPLMPPHAPSGNPVDLTFSMDIQVLTSRIPDLVMSSGEVDGIVIHGAMRSGFFRSQYPHLAGMFNNEPVEKILAGMPQIPADSVTTVLRHGMPVAVSSFFDRDDDYTALFEDSGIPVFDSPEKAANAFAAMLRHKEICERTPWNPPAITGPSTEAREMLKACLSGGGTNLDEHGSKLFLKQYGIPVTEELLARSESEAAAAADQVGYPAVMKASAGDILHKTGSGLIFLGIKTRDEAVVSYRKIQETAGRMVPVIVCRMVSGDREFVAGIIRSTGFGPAVMFGLGGILTEALGDTVFRPAPLSIDDATEMIHEIKSARLLGEFRGMPAVNTGSLARILHRLSLIPLFHPEVSEIDVNPIIIEGSEPVAVDALVVLNR